MIGTTTHLHPSEYERVKIFSLVKDEDGSISRVPMCLCELCRVNHFICPRYVTSAEKVLDELDKWIRDTYDYPDVDDWLLTEIMNRLAALRSAEKGEREQG